MQNAYVEANQVATLQTGRSYYYPLLNALSAQLAANWLAGRGALQPVANLESQLGAAEEDARQRESINPGFWNRVAPAVTQLLRFLVGPATEVGADLVVSRYRLAAKRGVTPSEWQSVLEHLDFIIEVAGAGHRPKGFIAVLSSIRDSLTAPNNATQP